jgi:hypothetical protein
MLAQTENLSKKSRLRSCNLICFSKEPKELKSIKIYVMAQLSKSILKAYFERGDKPSQAQFYSLIDSNLNMVDDRKYLGLKIYNTTIAYEAGDITVYNGLAYQANGSTTGTFDPAKWDALDLNIDIITKTYAELSSLKLAANLKAGQLYFISDRKVWIQATTTNSFSLAGNFMAINADYQNTGGNNVGIWNPSLSGLVANTSIAVWDNLHWLNLTGDVGEQPNGDSLNWELQTFPADATYIVEIDAIKYDFDLDFIFERSDKRGNFISSIRDTEGTLGSIPMEFFQWGRDGVDGNFVKNSVLNNINCLQINYSIEAFDFSYISLFENANCSNAIFSGATAYVMSTTDMQSVIMRNFSIIAVSTIITNPGKRLEPGYSGFETEVDITGQSFLPMPDYVGIVKVLSGNPTETLTACDTTVTKHPFEIRPAAGLLLTILNGSGSPSEFALPAASIDLNGDMGDFAKFRQDAFGILRLVEMVNYV